MNIFIAIETMLNFEKNTVVEHSDLIVEHFMSISYAA